jgi:predicted branched-subunit amino acid permease
MTDRDSHAHAHAHLTPREAFLEGVRDVAPVLLGIVPFGVVAGIATVSAGLTPMQAIGLSLATFSGIAQLVVAQLVAVQSPALVTVGVALVVSLRHLMYSAALAPHFAHLSRRWRWLLAYLMTDQMFAFGMKRFRHQGARGTGHWYFLGGSALLWASWQAAVVVGAIAGAVVPASWSLDFAVVLSFLSLLIPAIRSRADLAAAIVAAATALLASGLPFRLALVVASVTGIVAGMAMGRNAK